MAAEARETTTGAGVRRSGLVEGCCSIHLSYGRRNNLRDLALLNVSRTYSKHTSADLQRHPLARILDHLPRCLWADARDRPFKFGLDRNDGHRVAHASGAGLDLCPEL